MIESVPLIPENVPRARFLSEAEQANYEESIQRYVGKARTSLSILREGSNFWKIVLLNANETRTIGLKELGQILDMTPGFLENFYVDLKEAVLRTDGDSLTKNDGLAKYLFRQAKRRNLTATSEVPLLFKNLGLRADKNSPYGLVLRVTDETGIVEAPRFSVSNHGRKFSRIDEEGPIFAYQGNRTFYTRQDGLSGLCLDGDGDLDAIWDYLDDSISSGRVVVVDAEGVSQKKQ